MLRENLAICGRDSRQHTSPATFLLERAIGQPVGSKLKVQEISFAFHLVAGKKEGSRNPSAQVREESQRLICGGSRISKCPGCQDEARKVKGGNDSFIKYVRLQAVQRIPFDSPCGSVYQ